MAKAQGRGHRVIARELGVPATTVRGWLRRFTSHAALVRGHFTRLACWLDPQAGPVCPRESPVGQTPVVKRTGKRFGVNLISAISNEGLLRFRLFEGSFRGPVLVDFLRRLVGDLAGRKVHLILDGHPVHHAKLVSGQGLGLVVFK